MITRDGLRLVLRLIAAALVAAFPLTGSADFADARQLAQPICALAATTPTIEAWRKAVAALLPGKSGCFDATYPSRVLTARDCGKAQPLFVQRAPTQVEPFDEHLSGDVALVSPGSITTATGTMQKMERVAITGVIDQNGKVLNETNAVSFQLNTNSNIPNTASRSKCGSSNSNCRGWLQFTLDLDPTQGPVAQIQEWILNYGSGCPSGFTAAAGACVDNIAKGTIPGPLTAASLGGLVISGQVASNGQTSMAIFIPGRNLVYSLTGTDAVGAYGHWNVAEFNVFGEDNAEEVAFQQGSLMAVNVSVDSGVNATPVSCSKPAKNTGQIDQPHPWPLRADWRLNDRLCRRRAAGCGEHKPEERVPHPGARRSSSAG